MRRVRHGPLMVAYKPVSVLAAAHSTLYLQMPSLTVFKTLGAHARIQEFRCLRARFLNERAGPGAGRRRASADYDAQYIKRWRGAANKKLTQMPAMSGRRWYQHFHSNDPISWSADKDQSREGKLYQFIESRSFNPDNQALHIAWKKRIKS